MASCEDKRFFQNRFQDFDPSNPDPEILNGSDGLSQAFLDRIRSHRNRLLVQHLEDYARIRDEDYSVYTGKSGVALLYLFIANESRSNENQLTSGNHEDTLGINKVDFQAKGLELLEDCLQRLNKRRVTFLCGDAGPLAIAVAQTKSQDHLKSLIKIMSDVVQVKGSDLPDELLYGRVGYLYALAYVRSRVEDSVSDVDTKKVIDAILESGKIESKNGKNFPPLMYHWHEKYYLGAAHGLIGIMFVLLQHRSLISEEVQQKYLKPTVEYIKNLRYPSGNFPSSLGSPTDRLVHWCHGAPGAVHLFLEASKAFPDKKDEYLKVAERCGQVIWERGLLQKGYGLCHGVAGNGYAFLHLYQATGEQRHLYRAAKFAEFCFEYGKHGCNIADRPLSLFEGLAGTLYFLSDMLNPSDAKFPAFYL